MLSRNIEHVVGQSIEFIVYVIPKLFCLIRYLGQIGPRSSAFLVETGNLLVC